MYWHVLNYKLHKEVMNDQKDNIKFKYITKESIKESKNDIFEYFNNSEFVLTLEGLY